MEFKIDENLPAEVCGILHRAGHEATSVLQQKLGGRPDADVAEARRAEGRAIVTLDTDFGNILAYPPQDFHGIVVIRTDDQSEPVILTLISRFVAALESTALRGRLWIVEEGRIRIRGPE